MQLLITPLAARDLEEIGDYIALDNPTRAGSFVAELRAH
jgi:toxin ParE1/3/4